MTATVGAAGPKDCRVSRVETYLVGTRWRNFVFVRVETDDGIHGVGEGTLEWQAKAVEASVFDLARRHVIGRSAFQIERMWQDMFRNEFARGGPVVNSAIGAIEMALWDIVGKAVGRPVYDLLGGRCHERIPAYANAWYGAGADIGAVAEAAAAVAAKGYRGLKFDPFGSSGRDPERREIARAVDMVAAVREAVGEEMEILLDCHGRFSPGSAIEIARLLEPSRIYWFEEPCDPENVGALAKIGRSIKTRLATGERCYTKYHLQALLASGEVSVLQPDIIHVGGILEAKKMAAMADAIYIPVSFHNPFGPVATAAAIQLDACTTNIVMQESFCEYDVPWRFDLLENCPRPVNGGYEIPTRPGLGVDLNLDAVRAHPYDEDAYLPMWGDDWAKRF
ncbi:MAG: galactonate dehydratase [Rhodospirillaceae bacterium]|nr:galactonate dehydratase [Rhodospirillaceae bacterium]